MTTESKSLAEAILDEQARCRELLTEYKAIGPAGQFGYLMISQALQRTEAAVMAGDTVAMLRCYEELKGCE
jgi:hypothetical protein